MFKGINTNFKARFPKPWLQVHTTGLCTLIRRIVPSRQGREIGSFFSALILIARRLLPTPKSLYEVADPPGRALSCQRQGRHPIGDYSSLPLSRALARFVPLAIFCLVLLLDFASAQSSFPQVTIGVQKSDNPSDLVPTLQIVLLLTILSLAPSILIMMTSFTRIIVVFHFLRQSLATQTVPSNQILIGLALFITFFIMKPVIVEVNQNAIQPLMKNEITQEEAFEQGMKPIRAFMFKQTREKDLQLFVDLQKIDNLQSPDDVPLSTLIPAFIISELKSAFQIGFLLYLPMFLIDLVVGSILLSMGMMMLPPIMISMPFKILLFVLVDGWYLIVESLVKGF